MVAEALTEEEATAEIAARRAAEQESRRSAAAERAAKRKAKDAGRPDGFTRRALRVAGGRLVLSLSTVGCSVVVVGVCLLLLGAYAVGRRSAARTGGSGPTRVAAIRPGTSDGASPLLHGTGGESSGARRAEAAVPDDPDLSELLKVPAARRQGNVNLNQPASVGQPAREAGVPAEKLNYLQIESFQVTRDRSSERLRQDLAEVQAFLAERGVETFARRLPGRGYVLFSQQGLPLSQDYKARREAFRKRIEGLGKEYRRSGGQYEFKGCLFVSHSRSRIGRPA
jgi:hypothetical protein